jgi:hypothetical protein
MSPLSQVVNALFISLTTRLRRPVEIEHGAYQKAYLASNIPSTTPLIALDDGLHAGAFSDGRFSNVQAINEKCNHSHPL